MRLLKHGTLPTLSFLTIACAELSPRTSPRELLNVMRRSLDANGPTEELRALLRSVGFDWQPEDVSELDLDVAAVAEALEHKQWRCVFSRADGRNGCVFIDAEDEAGARAFFATVFPGATLTSVTLQPVDVCARYEPRRPSASSVPGPSHGATASGEANGRSTTADDAELS